MARTQSFRDRVVWQKALVLARRAYKLAPLAPTAEAFAVLRKITQAAAAVSGNISEGQGRITDVQFQEFLEDARVALYERQSQLDWAGELGYLDQALVDQMMQQGWELARLINGLTLFLGRGFGRELNEG